MVSTPKALTILVSFLRLVLTPLTYLGGVFYSASMLEKVFNEFWQGVIQVNPIYHMVNAFRYGFLGSADVNFTWR